MRVPDNYSEVGAPLDIENSNRILIERRKKKKPEKERAALLIKQIFDVAKYD